MADAQRTNDDVRSRLMYLFKTTGAMADLQIGVTLSLINLFRGWVWRVLTHSSRARIAIIHCDLPHPDGYSTRRLRIRDGSGHISELPIQSNV